MIIDAKAGTFNIIKMQVRPLDLFASQQAGLPLQYSFLSLTWGAFSDIDIGSETFAGF